MRLFTGQTLYSTTSTAFSEPEGSVVPKVVYTVDDADTDRP